MILNILHSIKDEKYCWTNTQIWVQGWCKNNHISWRYDMVCRVADITDNIYDRMQCQALGHRGWFDRRNLTHRCRLQLLDSCNQTNIISNNINNIINNNSNIIVKSFYTFSENILKWKSCFEGSDNKESFSFIWKID